MSGASDWLPSRAILVRSLPFAAFVAFLILGPYLPQSPWTAIVRYAIVAIVLAVLWKSYAELRRLPERSADWLLALVAGVAVFVAWILLDHDAVTFSRSEGFQPVGATGELLWPVIVLRIAGMALVVPVMEELFWRSFLMRWLERSEFESVLPSRVAWRPVLVTSALFALEHSQWLAGGLAGAAYAWLYIRTGNLWIPIAAHGLTNLLLGTWIVWTGNWQFW